jgi:hypothetical protein
MHWIVPAGTSPEAELCFDCIGVIADLVSLKHSGRYWLKPWK